MTKMGDVIIVVPNVVLLFYFCLMVHVADAANVCDVLKDPKFANITHTAVMKAIILQQC